MVYILRKQLTWIQVHAAQLNLRLAFHKKLSLSGQNRRKRDHVYGKDAKEWAYSQQALIIIIAVHWKTRMKDHENFNFRVRNGHLAYSKQKWFWYLLVVQTLWNVICPIIFWRVRKKHLWPITSKSIEKFHFQIKSR